MRNLTIKRTKSFVGCLMKMKLYIEDAAAGEMTINGVPCRKIGELKNGEEKTFVIDEKEARLFVIADKVSAGYCNDCYTIPAGDTDVCLSGKNQFNPANGNAFRFDGVTDAQALQNRKRGTMRGLIVLIVAVVVGALAGWAISSGSLTSAKNVPKDFYAEGMHITLTSNFSETEDENFDAVFESRRVAVLCVKDPFDLYEGFENYTLAQYGNMVLRNNDFDASVQLQNEDGLTYFNYQYTDPDSGNSYVYFVVTYKAPDGFWLVHFVTAEDDFSQYLSSIMNWAKSVEFVNE
ncbi:MAG: hypothetical protein IJ766_05650 [Clostridia bacterium]|nr:hypothetical protein [Clostridia bacterium]